MVSVDSVAFLYAYETVVRCSEVGSLVRRACDQECPFTELKWGGPWDHCPKKVLPIDIILKKSKKIML